MIKKVYKEGPGAREAIVSGVHWAAAKICLTQGPSGRNALLGRAYQFAELSNDGKTIAEDLYHDDEIVQLGVERVKSVALATFEKGGDNTTTAVNLLDSFTSLGMDMLSKNDFTGATEDPINVRNKIQTAAIEICKEIEKESKAVKTLEDIEKVAFAATENKEHAMMLANMFNLIGKDGVVTYEDSYDDNVYSEIIEGFEIEAGFSHEFLANKDDKTFTLDNPLVLVTNRSIDFKEQITITTKRLYAENIQNLIIISDSFSKEVLQSFLEAKQSNSFNIIAIKAPYFGKTPQMEDIAIALGATFFDKDSNVPIDSNQNADFGTAKRVIVSKDKTTFLKPKGDTKERIKELHLLLKENKSKFDQEQLKKRLAKLSGGVGVIKIGSETPEHTGYLRKKLLNGVNSVKSSLKSGAIKGGGLTLIEISDRLKDNILAKVIRSPYDQIQKNAGGNLEIKDNVLDPASNIIAAVMTAAREAGDILTVEFANADKYEKPKDYKEED